MALKSPFSKEWLLGATVGGYFILAIALYCFGWDLFETFGGFSWAEPPPVGPDAVLLLVIGMLVGLLDFLQLRSERFFRHKLREGVTCLALWLNLAPFIGFCLAVILTQLPAAGGMVQALVVVALLCFPLGIIVSVLNLLLGNLRGQKA